ncbi:PHD and RING finger domain-containing protein 1-like isoform 2-T2 [Pholidichthys leucotaenia]
MSDSDKCFICLSAFEKQTVASLENCQHVFCLECILQWSQTANTCPVDRISFGYIHQRRCPGGDIQKKIKVKTPKKSDDGDEVEGNSTAVFCEECGRRDRTYRMLVCSFCDSGYHMDCLTPTLTTEPEGDWICPDCMVTPHHMETSMLEEEISDGELTDLLSEMDEPAHTSSRLRPSTTNHPSSSTEPRRSPRIRSIADRSPHRLSQTSWHVPKYLLQAAKPPVTPGEVAQESDMRNTSM